MIWRCRRARANALWYNFRKAAEHKLAEPNVYDKGKIKSETEALRHR